MTLTQTDTGVIDSAATKTNPNGATTADVVTARLQALEQMDYATLRSEWRRLYRAPPPKRVARNLIMLGIAWKIQEQAYGGLSAAT